MENIYKGKIISTSHEYFHNYATVGFCHSEGDAKGLFINIDYKFEDDLKARSFVKTIEDKLYTIKNEKGQGGIDAEVSLKEPFNRNVSQYNSSGPVRFL